MCTLQSLTVTFALTGAKADERETLLDLLAAEPALVAARPRQTLIGDKNYFGRDFEHQLGDQDIRLLRLAHKGNWSWAAPHCSTVAAGHRVGQ